MNKMNEGFGLKQAVETCKYSLLDICTRIDIVNSQYYRLLNKLDVDFDEGSISKEPEPEVSNGLLRDIESIIDNITYKVNIIEKDLQELKLII